MKGIDPAEIERLALERGGTVTAVNAEVVDVARKGKGSGSKRGRPRYKAPEETRRIDPEDAARFYANMAQPRPGDPEPRPVVWVDTPQELMNVGEKEYSGILDANPDVEKWWYEFASFRLGHNCSYLPDYLVKFRDGHLEVHEVKSGRIEEDALAKMKFFVTAAPDIPLYVCHRGKKGFSLTRFRRGGPIWSTGIVPKEG